MFVIHAIFFVNLVTEDRGAAGSPTGSGRASSRHSRPVSSKANLAAKKKREQKENIEQAAMDLLNHFNHRNLEALIKVTRNTLEALRKRITSSSMVHYIGKPSIAHLHLTLYQSTKF